VDKGGVEMWVRMSEDVRRAVDQVLERNPAIGDTSRECPNGECGHVDRLSRVPAKKLLGFQAYLRKWATERKHLPLKDMAEAGGWLDTRSLEQCHEQADEATLLQVVSEPRKLRETIAETIAAASGNQ
jgi:hypothetical protein